MLHEVLCHKMLISSCFNIANKPAIAICKRFLKEVSKGLNSCFTPKFDHVFISRVLLRVPIEGHYHYQLQIQKWPQENHVK